MTTDDQPMRDFAKRLFSDPDQPDEPIAKPSGHVAREGGNPDSTPADPMRDYVDRLFGIDENARGLSRD
jgi:hypothetical protein